MSNHDMFRAAVLVAAEGFTFNGPQLSGRGSVPTLLRFGHKRGSVLGTLIQPGQLELDPSPPCMEELPVKHATGSISTTFTMCLYAVRACCSALKEMGNARLWLFENEAGLARPSAHCPSSREPFAWYSQHRAALNFCLGCVHLGTRPAAIPILCLAFPTQSLALLPPACPFSPPLAPF